MNRKLWILWLQGFEHAPDVVAKCLRSWRIHNAGNWDIVELDETNIGRYMSIASLIRQYESKTITKTAISEIIRIELLRTYGGLWVDATTYCNKPLDSWLPDYIHHGFFAFEQKSDRLLSSWFLYANRPNFIIDKWHDAVFEFVNSRAVIGTQADHVSLDQWNAGSDHVHYFWFHYLFGDLYKKDRNFRQLWDETRKMSADGPHLIQVKGMLNPIGSELKEAIVRRNYPLFKLTYKYQHKEVPDSNLAFLYQH